MPKPKAIILGSAVAIWLAIVICGMAILWNYAMAPGDPGMAPRAWPAASRIAHNPKRLTLVMALHPHCPCSRASVGELARLMTVAAGKLDAYVLFVQPPGCGATWAKTDLWDSAGTIPGVRRLLDDHGREMQLFGAVTSGQTVVYDGSGRLLFSGGITAARGHFGDNAGSSSIVALLSDQRSTRVSRTSVYGCPLFGSPSSKKEVVCPR